MKWTVLLMGLVILSSFAFADLGNFPNNFLTNGKFEGYIITGSDLGAIGVVSADEVQSQLIPYIQQGRAGIVRLDSETELSDKSILIGNPCVNKITAELLDNPSPCDKDFPYGKAFVRYYEKDGKKLIVAAGYDAVSTRKAAEYLAEFKSNKLSGNEVVLNLDSSRSESTPPPGVVAPPPESIINAISNLGDSGNVEENNTIVETKQPENKVQDEQLPKITQENKSNESSDNNAPAQIIVQEKGIFEKIFDWFRGLFGKK